MSSHHWKDGYQTHPTDLETPPLPIVPPFEVADPDGTRHRTCHRPTNNKVQEPYLSKNKKPPHWFEADTAPCHTIRIRYCWNLFWVLLCPFGSNWWRGRWFNGVWLTIARKENIENITVATFVQKRQTELTNYLKQRLIVVCNHFPGRVSCIVHVCPPRVIVRKLVQVAVVAVAWMPL